MTLDYFSQTILLPCPPWGASGWRTSDLGLSYSELSARLLSDVWSLLPFKSSLLCIMHSWDGAASWQLFLPLSPLSISSVLTSVISSSRPVFTHPLGGRSLCSGIPHGTGGGAGERACLARGWICNVLLSRLSYHSRSDRKHSFTHPQL